MLQKRGYKHYFTTGKIEVDSDTGCWIWLGSQFPDGYGRISIPHPHKQGQRWALRAQAYFWYLYRGKTSLDVGHECHRRLCVNLRHLRAVEHLDNMAIMYHYPIESVDKVRLVELWEEGLDYTTIAEKLMAPRPVIMKLMQQVDLAQLEFRYEH